MSCGFDSRPGYIKKASGNWGLFYFTAYRNILSLTNLFW
jgi:hypothetical protein